MRKVMEKGQGKGKYTLQTDNVFTRKEYIEREAICYQLEKQESIDGQPRAIRRARRIVANFPAADVVPVVRCKDCEYWDATQEAPLSEGCFLCTLEGGYPKGDFYCALGERRMDGTEPPKEET